MKILIAALIFINVTSSFAQNLWERNEKLICLETKTSVDDVNAQLQKQYGKSCDYLRDATRIVIGDFFKCPDGRVYPYFRSKDSCERFFMEGKKDLVKFVPTQNSHPAKWVQTFGSCMQTASQKQVNSMGLKALNAFCFCVANRTTDKMTPDILKSCSENLN